MTNVKKMPKRARQDILDFLNSRGGCLRTGHLEVWQMLFWRCFRKSSEGSTHEDVDVIRDIILELEAEGSVVLRRDDKGVVNYIALKSSEGDFKVVEEATNEELEELLVDVISQQSYAEKKLDAVQKKYDVMTQLATEAEAKSSLLAQELEESQKKVADLEATASLDGVRKILDAQETELASALKSKRMAELRVEELSQEIEKVSEKLATARSEAERINDTQDALNRKIRELTADLKAERKKSENKIAELQNELARLERGDGLTAVKATAAAISGLEASIDTLWKISVDAIVENCAKYLTGDKRANFQEELNVAYKKMQRRSNKK